MVVLKHVNEQSHLSLGGGLFGVDVFFVLSGFLITALAIEEYSATGAFSFLRFYARRALRLLPALLTLIGISTLYILVFAGPADRSHLLLWQVPALTFTTNVVMAATGGFDGSASVLTGHTWSLALEEQFYLLWPATLIFLILRPGRIGWPSVVGLSILIAGLAANQAWIASRFGAQAAYLRPEARLWEPLVGACGAIAVYAPNIRERLQSLTTFLWLPAAAVLVVFASGAWFARSLVYRGGFVGIAVAAAILLLNAVLRPAGLEARLLNAPPLRALGHISYGLYLWHVPVFALTPSRVPGRGVVQIIVSLAVAVVSHGLVERRFLRMRPSYRSRSAGAIGSAYSESANSAIISAGSSPADSGGVVGRSEGHG